MKIQEEDITQALFDLEHIQKTGKLAEEELKEYDRWVTAYAKAFDRILNDEVLPCWNT